jgi:hypothetical protein
MTRCFDIINFSGGKDDHLIKTTIGAQRMLSTDQSIPGGCMGKVLSVNLSNYGKNDQEIFEEIPIDPDYYKKLLTGYGLAAKIIYDNQEPGLGDLAEGNIFAVMSGLLTNTGAPCSAAAG